MLKQPGEGVDRGAGLTFCLDGSMAVSRGRANGRQHWSGGGSEKARVLEMVLSWSMIASLLARLREPQLVRRVHEIICTCSCATW